MDEGRYVDFTPVGQGGMGIVYWALDTVLSRQIAFKVIRPSAAAGEEGITPSAPLGLGAPDADTPDAEAFEGVCRRFRQEAWITGGMEHPGIVPVYELGATDAGVPYYTMRFVRGSRTLRTAIEALADTGVDRRLHELLEPFLKVCDTIRYAHSCGVIHRDLKPENVALGEYGEVVVLDWGLAKVKGGLDADEDPWIDRVQDTRRDGEFQTVASVLGTPGFMAPEAARGETEALDERSDVYALGVMLYQILTGRLPTQFGTAEEYTERVLAQDPTDPRESEPGTPPRLAELACRALARAPGDRPASADELAETIRAWRSERARGREVRVLTEQAVAALSLAPALRGEELLHALDRTTAACGRILELEPEHAEAKALLDRARDLRERGVQERERQTRQRTLRRVGGGALAIGLMAAVVVAVLLESRRREAALARRQAEADRARAEGVMNFMVFELRESLEPIGRLDVLARLGATARAYYADLPQSGLSTSGLIGHTVTLRRLGEVYEARGDLPAALEAFRLAGGVAERILARLPDDPIGRYHHSLAEARVGIALFRQGYASDAKRMFVEHREDVVRLLRQHPGNAEYMDALASAEVALGHILRTEGRWDDADRAFGAALAITTELETEYPGEDRWTRQRLERRRERAQLLRDRGLLDQAVAAAQIVLDECTRHMELGRRASDVRWMELAAACRHGVAVVHDALLTGDREVFDGAYQAYADLHALDPDNDMWRFRIAQIRALQSHFLSVAGEQEEALSLIFAGFAIARELTAKDPTNASWQNLLITHCDHLARESRVAGRAGEEILTYRALAAEHARHLMQLDPANAKWRHILAYTLSKLGSAYVGRDDAEARRLLRDSIAVSVDLVRDHPTEAELVVLQAQSRRDLGRLEIRSGRRTAGLQEWQRALDDLIPCWERGAPRYEVGSWIVNLHAWLAAELDGDPAAAARHLREALVFLGRVRQARAWSPGQLESFDSRQQALRRALEVLPTEEAPPK